MEGSSEVVARVDAELSAAFDPWPDLMYMCFMYGEEAAADVCSQQIAAVGLGPVMHRYLGHEALIGRLIDMAKPGPKLLNGVGSVD